jgi:FixJ family two-component response regulator
MIVQSSVQSVPTVMVVDDDAKVRASLSDLFESAGYFVETFATAQEFLARLPLHGACCVVLDLNLANIGGLELQAQLQQRKVFAPIVFLSHRADIPSAVRAMKAGAIDFLTKPCVPSALLQAIDAGLACSSDLHNEAREFERLQARYTSLTPSEKTVMSLVVAGQMNKQIAGDLAVAEQTVKARRGRVMRKMLAPSLAELVRMAAKLQSQ